MPARKRKTTVKNKEFDMHPVPSEPKKSNSILVPTLVIAVIILAFLAGSFWQKVKILESGDAVGGQGTSNLSIDNLKKYAKDHEELKLALDKWGAR